MMFQQLDSEEENIRRDETKEGIVLHRQHAEERSDNKRTSY